MKGGGAHSNECVDLGGLCSRGGGTQAEIPASDCLFVNPTGWSHLTKELCWQFCLVWVPSKWAIQAVEPNL